MGKESDGALGCVYHVRALHCISRGVTGCTSVHGVRIGRGIREAS